MDPLDIPALLNPAEHSRLLIALSSSAVVFGAAAMMVYASHGWPTLAMLAGFLAAFGLVVWLFLQVARSRLLGGAVRVSEATLPELQSAFDEVRTRLDYHKNVDVYVMDRVDGGSATTSYLGTRLIQIDGGLAAELLDKERHAELRYLIARHIGQLKARHQRLQPIFLAISVIDSLKFLQLFLAPYLRATAKSGDQIAAACCGDIRATAGMMNRLLAGKELGPRLAIEGVLRPPRRHPSLLSMLAATLVTAGLLMLAGWVIFGSLQATDAGTAAAKHKAAEPITPAARRLLARVPAGFAANCAPSPPPATGALHGADAAVVCQPRAARSPGTVAYLQYRQPGAMRHAFAVLSRALPAGNCRTTQGQGSYSLGSPARAVGDLGCSVGGRGQHVFWWTDNRLGVLSYAVSSEMTFAGLYQWWHGDSGPGPAGKVTPIRPRHGITITLSAYFNGINARNYRLAWSQLSAADQAANPYRQFAAGESTTTIATWKLHGIAKGASPGTYIAFVAFQSHQDPAEAPNHSDSCDFWALNYTMIQRSDRWLISAVGPHPPLPEYQSC